MSCILNFILRRPVLSVLVLGLFVSFAGYNGSFVIRDASVDGLIIKGEEKDYYDSVQDIFGDDTMVSILIKADSGVFQEPILEAVKNISDGVAGIEIEEGTASIPVVSHVSSLSTVNKILNKDGFLDTDKLMDYLPDGEEEIEVIKVDAIRNELLYNDLLSRDLKTAAVNVFLPSAPVGSANYNQNVTRAIENVIQKERERLLGLDLEVDIFQIGMPNVKVGLADLIARDMQVLIPLAVAVILCVLWIAFRTPIAVILPLVTGISSVLGCLAFMAFMGYTINLVSNIVPLLLLVIGSTEDIHMLADYKYQVRHAKGKLEAIRNMLLKCSLAIFLTSLTTALGFLTLKVNPIQMLKEFGISAAVGLGLNYILTIIAVPTLLKFMPVPKHFRESQKKSPLVQKLSANLYSLAVNHRVAIGLMTAFISVLSIAGCLKIKVDADLVSFFKEDNPIRIKLQQLEQNLSGGQSFKIVVNTQDMGIEEGVKEPAVLKAMDLLEAYLRTRFDYVVSPVDYLKVFNREFNDSDVDYFRIPETPEEVSQMLLLLEGNEMERLLGPDYVNASIVVRHHVYGSWRLSEELDKVEEKIKVLFPVGVRVRITGEGILFNKASDTMAIGQVTSLAFAVVIIFFIISILFVSPKAGLLAMVPNGMPILMNFGVMGWFGLSLNPGTCTVAVIALGIAIDDTIHLMVQFYKELKKNGDQCEAMRRTLDVECLPVLSSSIALGLGFSVLVFADVVSSVHFGFLASFAMLNALLSDLLIAPALLVSIRLISSWDLLKLKISEDTVKGSLLFRGMKLSELKKVVLMGVLRAFKDGEVIIHQGTSGREMYLILEGGAEVRVDKNGGQAGEVKKLFPGDIFGEITFVTGGERSANVIALGSVEVLKIDDSSLLKVKEQFPRTAAKLFYNLSSILGDRLRTTTAAWQTERR